MPERLPEKREARVCFRPGREESSLINKERRRTKRDATEITNTALTLFLGWHLTYPELQIPDPAKRRGPKGDRSVRAGQNFCFRLTTKSAICLNREVVRTGESITNVICRCIRQNLRQDPISHPVAHTTSSKPVRPPSSFIAQTLRLR